VQSLPTDRAVRVIECEVLVLTSGIRNAIREGETHQFPSAMQSGGQYGKVTMNQSFAELHRRGLASLEMALQRAGDPNTLKSLLGPSRQ
jgi:twitching motility protein PilT